MDHNLLQSKKGIIANAGIVVLQEGHHYLFATELVDNSEEVEKHKYVKNVD